MVLGQVLWDRHFDHSVQSPVAWLASAQGLRRGAELIWAQYEKDVELRTKSGDGEALPQTIPQVAMMLWGLALENLFKAVLAHQVQLLKENGELSTKHHNLPRLAEAAGLTLATDERELLIRLTGYSTWRGRYPVPLKREELYPQEVPGIGLVALGCVAGRDPELIRKLWSRVEALLTQNET